MRDTSIILSSVKGLLLFISHTFLPLRTVSNHESSHPLQTMVYCVVYLHIYCGLSVFVRSNNTANYSTKRISCFHHLSTESGQKFQLMTEVLQTIFLPDYQLLYKWRCLEYVKMYGTSSHSIAKYVYSTVWKYFIHISPNENSTNTM